MGNQRNTSLLIVLLSVVLLLCRLVPFVQTVNVFAGPYETPLFKALFGFAITNKVAGFVTSAVWMLLTAFLTQFVLNRLWVFESHKLVSLIITGLLLSAGGAYLGFASFLIAPMVLLLILLVLFGAETDDLSPLKVFNLTFFLAVGNMLNAYLLLLLPLFWGLFIYLRQFSFKLLLASVVGVLAAYWILASVLILQDNLNLLQDFFTPLSFNILDFKQVPQGYYVYIPLITLLALVAFFSFTREYPKMKQSHRVLFITSNGLAVYVFFMAVLGLMPFFEAISMALISFVMIFSLLFFHSKSRTRWMFFSVLVIALFFAFIDKF